MPGAIRLPPCGLYRTTKALPGAESEVGEGLLVNFHDHGTGARAGGVPVVLLPAFSVFNRWQWRREPHPVRQLSWVESLVKLPLEGFYALRRPLPLDDGRAAWPSGTLVQLGYDRAATPIVFMAQLRANLADNFLWFADRGLTLDDETLATLQPLGVYEEPDPNATDDEAPGV